MEKQKVFFENSKGLKLCGILSAQDDKKVPLIVLCHGFGRTKEGWTHLELEKTLNEEGVSTLRFDFFGHGESEGKFEDITTSEAVDDVIRAVEFLRQKGYEKIGLFGSSFGGMASLIAASKRNDIYTLALKSPVSDSIGSMICKRIGISPKEWKEKGYMIYQMPDGGKKKLNYSFFEDAENLSGYNAAKKIEVPTLIVHGSSDDIVPIEQSKKLSKIIKNCRLKVIEGCDHKYTNEEHKKMLIKEVTEFIFRNSK